MDPSVGSDAVFLSGFQHGNDAGTGDAWADGLAVWNTGLGMEKDTAGICMLHTKSYMCGCIFDSQVGKR